MLDRVPGSHVVPIGLSLLLVLAGCARGAGAALEPHRSDARSAARDAGVEADAAALGVSETCGSLGATTEPGACPIDPGPSSGPTDAADTATEDDGGTCEAGEPDADQDGTPDCGDDCPDDPDKILAGVCGCGVADGDRDGDGTDDCDDRCPDDADKTEPGACDCGLPDVDRTGDGDPDCAVQEDAFASAGYAHSCARGSDGKVYCWGAGGYGRLGNGSTADSSTPTPVAGLVDVVQVSNRGMNDRATSCAVLADGGVRCWGYGGRGTIGNGATVTANSMPLAVSGIDDALQVSVGGDHVCAVRGAGAVACWGEGASGKLGNGATSNTSTPVSVQWLGDALQVSAGDQHSCALRATGAVACWGLRDNGRLGDGGDTAGAQSTPAVVSGIDDAVQVSAGYQHSCAVRAAGTVACWGLRTNGRLGDGGATSGNQSTPVTVVGLDDAVQVSAGFQHTCAVRATGAVMCWGYRARGRMGDGATTGGDEPTPVAVSGIADAVQVVAGRAHSCAASAVGVVSCWGDNGNGRLGDGTTVATNSPVPVGALP